MTLSAPTAEPDVAAAYADHDRQIALRRIRIGCVLAVVLLPFGAVVDLQVYPELWLARLLPIRIAGALLMLPLWAAVQTAWGQQNHRLFGVALAMVPAGTMAVIVHQIGDAGSPYYAGLNLVLLTIGLLLQWTTAQSLVAVALVVAMYLGVCALVPAKLPGAAFNNLYFLAVTGLIVVIGNSIASGLRFREFAAQHRLRRSQREIEHANAELKRSQHELEASYERLRELDQAKSRFFANISHELRTPLTLLLGPLDALAQRQGRLGEEEVRGHLGTMQANGLRLLKLINDLLDLERLDSGHIAVRREAVEVPQFLGGLVNSARKLAEDRRIQLRIEVPDSLGRAMLDADKLEKVLLNLLINAIKFTAGGGRIICRADRLADRLVVAVSDSGVGIQPDHLPHIFDRFWQADTSSQRKHQGAGIGLALVKELIEAQDGQVTVESEVDRGTTFTLTLPWIDPPRTLAAPEPVPGATAHPSIAEEASLLPSQPADSPGGGLTPPATPPAAATDAEPPAEPRDAWLVNLYRRAELFPGLPSLKDSLRPDELTAGRDGRPRVLIADDEPDMLRFLRSQLAAHYQVFEAVDGQQAIEKAAQFLPDIVLTDMMMPEKDGLDVCRELRARFPTRDIPIVMLTARADDETKLAALAAGASDFLAKPFSTAELRARLKNLIGSRQLQKELAWQNQKLQATLEELKETETQLVQSEKMASLGRMSAGIIHEINNPLNYAKTGVFTLQKMGRFMPPEELADYEDIVKDIGDGLTRVAGIVTDLRAFTHPHGGQMDDIDVRAVADGALRFLAAELKDCVTVENGIPPGFRVRANRNKLIQVFVNLLQNGVDALKEKQFPAGETACIRLGADDNGALRVITLRDNGPGIPSEILGKIFDPFFTTKDVGKGTGLGLSICYRIINEAGGRIVARSEPGQWTEFALEFPVTV